MAHLWDSRSQITPSRVNPTNPAFVGSNASFREANPKRTGEAGIRKIASMNPDMYARAGIPDDESHFVQAPWDSCRRIPLSTRSLGFHQLNP
jgi:hypothetical protein